MKFGTKNFWSVYDDLTFAYGKDDDDDEYFENNGADDDNEDDEY